jgi:ubiquinone biosynthesis protein UbiJ
MEPVEASDLRVQLDVSNPGALMMQVASGGTPSIQVDGDAQLAGDVQWLLAHLRWDVAADVERIFGPATAQWVTQWGAWVKRALLSWKNRGAANPGTGPGAGV